MERLDEPAIVQALESLPAWQRQGDALVRELRFKNFRDAIAFVNRIAEVAEEQRHHPDITIRYNRVQLLLTTHEAGGITERDVEFARRVDELIS